MSTERGLVFPGPDERSSQVALAPVVDVTPFLKTPEQQLFPTEVELLNLIGQEPGVPVPILAIKTHFENQERGNGDKYLRTLFAELRPKLALKWPIHHHHGTVWLGNLSETKLSPEERAIWTLKPRQFRMAITLYQQRGVPMFKEQLFTCIYGRKYNRDNAKDEDNLKQCFWELNNHLAHQLGTKPLHGSDSVHAYWWGELDKEKIPEWLNFDPQIPAVVIKDKPYLLNQDDCHFLKHWADTQFKPFTMNIMAQGMFGDSAPNLLIKAREAYWRFKKRGLPIGSLTGQKADSPYTIYGRPQEENLTLPASLNPALFKAGNMTMLTPDEVIIMMALTHAHGLPLEQEELEWELTDTHTKLSVKQMATTICNLQAKLTDGLTIADHKGAVWLQQAGVVEQNKTNEVFTNLTEPSRKLAIMLYQNRGMPLSREQLFFRVYGRKFREGKDAEMWHVLIWRTVNDVNQRLGQQTISLNWESNAIHCWGPVDNSKIPDFNHYQPGQAAMRLGEKTLFFTPGERQFLEWWVGRSWQCFTVKEAASALYKNNNPNALAAIRTLTYRLRKLGLPISMFTYDSNSKQFCYSLLKEALWHPLPWLDYQVFKQGRKVKLSAMEIKLLFHLLQDPGVPWEADDLAYELSDTDIPISVTKLTKAIAGLQAKLKSKFPINYNSTRDAVWWGKLSTRHLTRVERAIWQLTKMQRRLIKVLYEHAGLPISANILFENIYGRRGFENIYGRREKDSKFNEDQMIRVHWFRIRSIFPVKLAKSYLHNWRGYGIYYWGKLDREQIPTLANYNPQIPAVKIKDKIILLTEKERKFINWCFNNCFNDFTAEEAAHGYLESTKPGALNHIRVMKMRLEKRGLPIFTEMVDKVGAFGVYKWDLDSL